MATWHRNVASSAPGVTNDLFRLLGNNVSCKLLLILVPALIKLIRTYNLTRFSFDPATYYLYFSVGC